ncbi:MAG: exodeoxyribonuclease V subunit gamma [Betaproteobacteria bacterium]|nr:exodeoxyribonuclease V subunit gamma [Betaproteobacteria bacterium]
MLQIEFSNRYERLQDSLLDAMDAPPASPFVSEEIIVPSAATRRRVELAVADRFGICSNIRFSFLAQWLWRQIGHVVPVSEISPFTASVLTWRALSIFGEQAFVAEHPPLAGYLRHADDVMRYELAASTATLLEHYLTYRPNWLAAWLEGKPAGIGNLDPARQHDERWQAALWRRIARDLGTDSRHPSVAFFDAMKAMGPDAPARAGLPAIAHVFCLPTTPPLYLDILNRLAQWIDLRLYVLNPCREYWFDIVDPKRLSYLAANDRADHHEIGNRLLAAWGKQTRAHIDLLLRNDSAAIVDDADFAAAESTTLLARVQNAILDLTDLTHGSVLLGPDDRSIEVHVCHSLTRELEVLQDQLLALFASGDPPRPSDVLVVTPDLEAAAPLIDAVFGNAPKDCEIPYTITGRPASVLNPCAHALLTVLDVATSRLPASAVFELLQQPIIARRFAIGDDDLDAIHAWIGKSGIRWGFDARHRGELGLPATGRHSFSDGLDRLFLGYALPASANVPLNGRLPAGDPEGSGALALGSFGEFFRRLEYLHGELARPKSPAQWQQVLLDIVADFVDPAGDEIDDQRDTVAAIHELQSNMARGGISQPLLLDVVRHALRALLGDPTRGGMPGGAVTFAAMSSLRNLPYRFVCVLGLNDGAFPATQQPREFDLLARDPQPGDQQRRIDDRNVFLDLLLAARQRLYLSFTGHSIRDDATLPPSVLVAELLDYCAAATDAAPFTPESLQAARDRLVVLHPLQSFSLDYFKPDADPRRRSFNGEYCEALKERLAASASPPDAAVSIEKRPASASAPATAGGERGAPAESGAANEDDDEFEDENAASEPQQKFFSGPLAEPGPELREVTLDRLVRFFANPCRYLLRERLGIVLPEGDEELQDEEPFLPDWHARDALAKRVLQRLLAGATVVDVREFARAGVEYPDGRVGDIELARELRRLDTFARALAPALAEKTLAPILGTLDFTLDGEAWRLTGEFGDLRSSGLIRHRYDDARARDYLEGWIAHLFVNAVAPPGVAARTTWHSRDGHYVLPPVDGARDRLEAVLALYRAGLQRPLHFFPKSAWKYVSEGESWSRAASIWKTTPFHEHGEDRDAAYRLALRGVDDPLDDEFAECAKAVFQPLLEVIVDERLKARG